MGDHTCPECRPLEDIATAVARTLEEMLHVASEQLGHDRKYRFAFILVDQESIACAGTMDHARFTSVLRLMMEKLRGN